MLATLFSLPLPIFTFYMPRHPSRKRSLAWQRTVCERQRFRSFFFSSYCRKWSVFFFFRIHSGLQFCHANALHIDSFIVIIIYLQTRSFFLSIFFFFSFIIVSTYWRWLTCLNDYAIHLSATVFLLYLWSCHDLPFHSCFFSLQSVQNKNANWGQLQKKKTSTWLEKWEIFGKSNTTLCHAQQIKIGCQLKTRRMQIVATMQPKTNKNKELFSSTFLTVYFIYCSFFILNFFSSWKNSRNRLCL